MKPEISVVMPVYNVPKKWLEESIESILNQTFKEFEFIIVDDGSITDVQSICKSYADLDSRVRFFRLEKNVGIDKALNFGISKSETNIIARHDADDISLPTRLEKQYAYLKENKKTVLVGSNIDMLFEEGVPIWFKESAKQFLEWYNNCSDLSDIELIRHIPIASATFMYYKDKFIDAGMYNNINYYYEEELVLRIRKYGDLAKINEKLFLYRRHRSQVNPKYRSELKESRYASNAFRIAILNTLMSGCRTALWGTGNGGRDFLETFANTENCSFSIDMLIDGSENDVGKQISGYMVQAPEAIDKSKIDKIIVAVSVASALKEIRSYLAENGYENKYIEIFREVEPFDVCSCLNKLLDQNSRVALWGTGKGGKDFINEYLKREDNSYKLNVVIDGTGCYPEEYFCGIKVASPNILDEKEVDSIIVAVSLSSALSEIREILNEKGYADRYYEVYAEVDDLK